MSYSTILTELKTLLDAVSGIGTTHDYIRLSHDDTTLKTVFVTGGVLHTWMITRSSAPGTNLTIAQTLRNHNWDIYGFYAIDDSEGTEKTFQQLADAVMNKFDEDSNVVLLDGIYIIPPAQLVSFENVMFCGVLCHRILIRIVTQEELVRG